MLRRKFMQLVLVASSSGALAVLGTTARASGGASRNDNGASVGHSESNENHSRGASVGHSETNETHNSGASVNHSEPAESHSSGASINHTEVNEYRNDDSSIGHSESGENHNGGASRNHAGGSIYCATDANGLQNCQTVNSDGLSSVSDADLDDVLKSFN
jgi:hypothetical protein